MLSYRLVRSVLFALSIMLTVFAHRSYAQNSSWPAYAAYTFETGLPDQGCGVATHVYGYGTPASMSFSFDFPVQSSGTNYAWEMDDDQGVIASGSFNGYSGTGGTSASGATFSLARIPIGDLSFGYTEALGQRAVRTVKLAPLVPKDLQAMDQGPNWF